MLLAVQRAINNIFRIIEIFLIVVLLLTVLNIAYDVFARYAFNDVSIAFQEMEWHLFSVLFLVGIAYTLKYTTDTSSTDTSAGHVRVDFLYEKFSPKTRAWINILGAVFFVIPLGVLIVYYGISFTYISYQVNEISGDPGGLTNRWIIKAIIPLSFSLTIIASIGFAIDNLITLKQIKY